MHALMKTADSEALQLKRGNNLLKHLGDHMHILKKEHTQRDASCQTLGEIMQAKYAIRADLTISPIKRKQNASFSFSSILYSYYYTKAGFVIHFRRRCFHL